MATTTLTEENFAATINENDIVLVDFWATWCGPCRQFSPVYEAASSQHSDIVFGKVDTDEQQQLAGALNISSIPTVMAFREGVLVFADSGAMPQRALAEVIDQIRNLPMEKIHAEIAEKEANGEAPGATDA